MTHFYIAPDFLSSHDSGMLNKKLQLKKKNSFFCEKNKNKNSKIKNITYTSIVLTSLEMHKKPVNPLTVSYVAQGNQQKTIAPHTNLPTYLN